MDETEDPRKSAEELAVHNTLSIEAMVRIFERKGIMTREEVLNEIANIKQEFDDYSQLN